MRHARRVLRVGIIIIAQLVAVLVLLEIVARVFDPLGISYYPETARYLDTLVLEEPIGYRNRPGLDQHFYGVPVKINSAGLRDREPGPKPPGEFRILVMGDSVPFGIGSAYEDSFPHQLERILNTQASTNQYRTINMGVPSYNTEQQLIQLQTLGLSMNPDAALLLFSSNDIEPKLWVLEKRKIWYVDAVQRSYAGSLLYMLSRKITAQWPALVESTVTPRVRDTSLVALDQYHTNSQRWQAVDHSLTAIAGICKERHIRFVLFTNNELPFIVELLEKVARREGFPLVNLRRQEDPRWAGHDGRLFHNSVTDGHPSPLGNLALATLMAEKLRELGVLPQP